MFGIKKYWRWYTVAGLTIAVILLWKALFSLEAHQGKLFFHVFDIGQGDALFIEAPNGNQVLIDGGPSNALLAKLGKTMPFWDRSIDLLVLSHPHVDHVIGLIDVLKRYHVGMVIESGVNYSTAEYGEWHTLLDQKHIPVVIAERGDVVHLARGVDLRILAPFESFVSKSPKNVHDATVVMKLSFASSTALLMGDAESELEYQFLAQGVDLRADILKVGHHGSKTSSTNFFLEAVRPYFAVISAGRKNRYGHPTQEVLDRLQALGISIQRTDRDGDITYVSDGQGFRLEK